MKKILLASLVAIAPVIASAQVQLISGYNFGQFLGAGAPAIDGDTFEDDGFIGANWAHSSPPPLSSSGDNTPTEPYSNGTGTVFWNGTAGSSSLLASNSIVAFDNPSFSLNAMTVTGTNMALVGDHGGANMALDVQGAFSVGFRQDMAGFAEAGANDLTFAAQAASAPITIDWVFNSSVVASTLVGTSWAVYTVDLPTGFYGALSDLTATFSGAGRLDNVQFNGQLAAIPEPSTYAAILGACTLGFVMIRRRRQAAAAV